MNYLPRNKSETRFPNKQQRENDHKRTYLRFWLSLIYFFGAYFSHKNSRR